MNRALPTLVGLLLFAHTSLANAQVKYRTDNNQDESLSWYQTKPGTFPPKDSAHYFSGELIKVDHVNRKGILRVDRTDAQRRSHWDLSVEFRLLPYGSLAYHNAPASIKEIPLGTHLHGWFYIKDADEQVGTVFHNRKSLEADFTKALRFEDDFSYYSSRNQIWRVDQLESEDDSITMTLIDQKKIKAIGKPTRFNLTPSTRYWQNSGVAKRSDVAAGQLVQINLTWATLYGPGRITDIWLDEESRNAARQNQLGTHIQHQRDRGLAGWINRVDNEKRVVTATLFGGVDASLLKDLTPKTSLTAVVAETSLRSYDQVNDRKSGPLLDIKKVDMEPGSSGVQIQFQPSLLLEGFRPGRIVRVFPNGWPVQSIPLEERLWPARD